MRVIICGAGQVGHGIASKLTAEGHEVTIIDKSAEVIESLCNKLDIRGIVGYGSHPDILSSAGAEEADMLLAVTRSDETNIIACQIANRIFDIPTKIARIRAQSYLQPQYKSLFSNEYFAVDVTISPEVELAQTILRRLALQDACDIFSFANNEIVAVGLECIENCPVLNTPLRCLTDLFPDLEATIVAIKRQIEGEETLEIAHSDSELNSGDIAYIVTKRDKLARLCRLFDHAEKNVSRVVIAGGGNVGLYVARFLEQEHKNVKIALIEHDRARAQYISGELLRTKVLHGSALDVNLFNEANIQEADLFISLTDNDQVNVLSAILAKKLHCKTNMALVNNSIYQEFNRNLGVDIFLNPRSITISRILQQMRRGRILSVYELADSKAEIFEAEVCEASVLLNRPLRELELASGLRIGAIFRDNEVLQPKSDTVIKNGDRVVIFALSAYIKDVEYLFRTSTNYLKS